MQVHRGEAILACGGVAGVGTLTEHRQSGVAAAFMTQLLHEMSENGHDIAALYAYKESFYRRFGYETCGWRWKLTCPQSRFPRPASRLTVRQIDPEDVSILDEAYRRFIRRRSGSAIRRPSDWTHRLGKKAPMIYAVGDPIEGYCWGTMEQFWGDLSIGEIAWATPEAYEALLGLIAGMASNQSRIIWNEPPDSPFLASYLDQGVQCELHRPTMYRVLDVPGALQKLRAAGEGEFSIEVNDEIVASNRGPWHVSFGEGGVRVAQTASAELHCDIRAFSQAFMGQPSLVELCRLGRIDSDSPEAMIAASRLMPALPVVCMEFF